LRNPTQVNGDSVSGIRTKTSRYFTNKEEYVLKIKLSASKKSKGETFDNI